MTKKNRLGLIKSLHEVICTILPDMEVINEHVSSPHHKKMLEKIIKTLKEKGKDKIEKNLSSENGEKKKKGGFDKKGKISEEFREFLQIDEPEIDRRNITIALNVYCYKNSEQNKNDPDHVKWFHLNPDGRDLRTKDDRRVIDIKKDPKLCKLLKYDQYEQDVKDGKIYKDYSPSKYDLKMKDKEFKEDGETFIKRAAKIYKVEDVTVGKTIKKRLIETDPKIMLCT